MSAEERREADRFFADLVGTPPRSRRRNGRQARAASAPPRLRVVDNTVDEDGPKSEADAREAVVAAALAERDAWALRRESDPDMYGRLVRCYLAIVRDLDLPTLAAMQTAAESGIDYGRLLDPTVLVATLAAEARRVRKILLGGAAVSTDLAERIDNALLRARQAHLGRGTWSSAFISLIAGQAATALGLEADQLLRAAAAHRIYTLAAFERRRRGETSTYHAFSPSERAPRAGDIIVQDRQARTLASALTFGLIRGLASPRQTHGDIVVAIEDDAVVTIGGNVHDSVRRRRFPLRDDGRLVIDRARLYVQENDRGVLPIADATSAHELHGRSTARIFAVLSPIW